MQMFKRMSVVGLLLLGGCLQATPLKLAQEGKTEYVVVVASDADARVRFVAQDLTKILKEVTGAEFPLVDEGTPVSAHTKRIEVDTARARQLAGTDRVAALKHNGALEMSVDADIVLVGSDVFGTVGAVYDFLQKRVGCRWYTPMDAKIPHRPTLELEPFEGMVNPPCECRWLITLQNVTDKLRNGNLFLIRNGFNTNGERSFPNMDLPMGMDRFETEVAPATRMVHTFLTFMPPHDHRAYFKNHPEWFGYDAQQKRRLDNRQLCFSNPGLRAEFTKNLLTAIGQKGGYGVYSITQEDYPGVLCSCPECLKLVKKYDSPGGPLYDFIPEVAAAVKAQYPKALIDIIAYHHEQTQRAPQGGNLHFPDNVVLTFAPIDDDITKQLDHANNIGTLRDFEEWSKLIKRIWVWYYPLPYPIVQGVPFSGVRRSAADLKLMLARGMTGAKYEHDVGRDVGANFFDLQTWIFGRLFREPNADVEALVREFCNDYYGAASGIVRKIWDDYEKLVAAYPSFVGFSGAPQAAYTPRKLMIWQRAFDAAEAKVAGDETLLQHVREARIGADLQLLTSYPFVRVEAPADLPTAQTIHDRLVDACNKAHTRRGFVTATDIAGQAWRQKLLTDIEGYYRIAKAENIKPAELKDVPDADVIQVLPDCMGSGRQRVEDEKATFGYATWVTDREAHRDVFPCFLHDKVAKKVVAQCAIRPVEAPEGAYKIYKVGCFEASEGSQLVLGPTWQAQHSLIEYYQAGATVSYDLYVSLKFEGPRYYPASQRTESRALFDRAILVRRR